MQGSGQLVEVKNALKEHAREMQDVSLQKLFDADKARAGAWTHAQAGLRFDFAKNHITAETLSLFQTYADACDFDNWRAKLFAGDIVNPSEERAALHTALRAHQPIEQSKAGEEVAALVKRDKDKLYTFARNLRVGDIAAANGAAYKHIIFVGIGGSSLGPALLIDSLGYGREAAFDVHIVSNIDGHAMAPVLEACDPARTLLVVASKTFTTVETLTNAQSVQNWMREGGVSEPWGQTVAITAAPDKAIEKGVSETHLLPFANWVGGRYSLWSAISAPLVFAYGEDVFEAFLKGGAMMDDHFRDVPLGENLPFIAAAIDVWYSTYWGAETRGMFIYDERLRLLLDYTQQLEMESNGKDRLQNSDPVDGPTTAVLWGGVGTDCQHAVFQLMHQGTHLVPAEFIGVKEAAHDLGDHHMKLMANMFAQGAALMKGRTEEAAYAQLDGIADDVARGRMARYKSFRGNRPSTTIMLDALTPEALGALIAFYEHRTYAAGVLMGINVFDQMGVELGKELAKGLESAIAAGGTLPDGYDASTHALMDYLLKD